MQRSDKRGFKIYASADQAHQDQRIGRIIAGDREAFRALVCDYHPLAYSLAFKTLNNRQDAEEVVQDAFVKIYHALDGFRGEASLKTWILRIVLRLSLNRRRDRARTVALSCCPSGAGSAPIWPADTSTFCAEMALCTSDGISLTVASL